MEKTNAVAMSNKKTVNSILSQESVKARFIEILGKNANAFVSSIISATKSNSTLSDCEPESVISSAVIAATLNLPIQSNLGFAHIVPYKKDGVSVAQFQMGYKGYIQLALRTGQYKNINASEIYEGELIKHDRITGDVEIDTSKKKSNKIVGYVSYFKLLNGFEKMLYMSKEQIEIHGGKYSKSYSQKYGRWQQDFDSMALKTVIKLLLSKYGILSVDMQTAIIVDQSVIKNAETMDVEYVDGTSLDNEKPSTESKIVKESSSLGELKIEISDMQMEMNKKTNLFDDETSVSNN